MRKLFSFTILSAALAASACKRTDDHMDKAGDQMQKAAEQVNDRGKDVASDRTDLTKHETDLDRANADLTRSKDEYVAAGRERLARIDARINELSARTDAKAHEEAQDLKIRRDELARRLDNASARARTDWDAFKKDVNDGFDKLESDVDDALK